MDPSIIAIGTTVPDNRIEQSQIAEFMAIVHQLNEREHRALKVLYRATGIGHRHTVIKDYTSTNPKDWTFYPQSENLRPFPSTARRAQEYKSNARILSKQAIDNCLAKCDVDASEITHLITVSCTGMYAPGLDIDIIQDCGLSRHIERTAINFMGCYAAITAIRQANNICKTDKTSTVLVICIELCTLHFQNEKTDDNLLANSIFSDGAAALIISNGPKQFGLRPINFYCDLVPEGSQDMAWNIGDFGYEMKLSSYVPDLIQSGINSLIEGLTANSNSKPEHYAIHPGGKKILQVIETELEISRDQNVSAHEILREFGNMSSPTILFVLERLLEKLSSQNKGEKVLCLAFGPGLTLESMLLEIT